LPRRRRPRVLPARAPRRGHGSGARDARVSVAATGHGLTLRAQRPQSSTKITKTQMVLFVIFVTFVIFVAAPSARLSVTVSVAQAVDFAVGEALADRFGERAVRAQRVVRGDRLGQLLRRDLVPAVDLVRDRV